MITYDQYIHAWITFSNAYQLIQRSSPMVRKEFLYNNTKRKGDECYVNTPTEKKRKKWLQQEKKKVTQFFFQKDSSPPLQCFLVLEFYQKMEMFKVYSPPMIYGLNESSVCIELLSSEVI